MLHNQTNAAKTTTTTTSNTDEVGSVASSSTATNSRVNNNARQIKIGNYVLGATIGKGNSAVVKIATHVILKQKVAIKMFDKSALDIDKQHRLRREIESMKRLKHQNIIQLYEIMETPKLICLVTEYASNGELYEYIIRKQRLTEREAKPIFRQIVTAVHFCHVNHIVHRDIKVENLLLDAGWQVKLADFGFSSFFKTGELLDVFCGSPPYSAPELYQAKLYNGPRVDIWSLGVVLYVLVCGFLPFDAQVINLLRAQVIAGQYKIPFFLSEDCKSLINGMLTVDTEKRFTMNDIINHKWLNSDHEVASSVNSRISTSITSTHVDSSSTAISTDRKEFRQLIDKIENISIQEFVPDSNVLNELIKFNLNPNEIARSVVNHEFDSNAGIYYLLEARLNSNLTPSLPSTPNNPMVVYRPFSYDINNNTSQQASSYMEDQSIQSVFKPPITITDHDIDENVEFQYNQIKRNKSNTVSFSYEARQEEEKSRQASWSSHQQPAPLIHSEENEEEDDDDEGMDLPIEELGKDYLSRYNSVRRHTIASNTDNDKLLSHNNEIMKSTECLLHKLNENLLGSCNQGSSSNNNLDEEDQEDNDNDEELDENNDDETVNSASKYKKSSHPTSGRNSATNKARHQLQLPAVNMNNGFLSPNYHNHFHHQQRKTRFKHHHHYRNKFHGGEKQSPPQQQSSLSSTSAGSSTTGSGSSGRRASDGGSNISLFSQFYSLKNPFLNTNNPNNPNQTTLLPTTTNTTSSMQNDDAKSNSLEESLEKPATATFYKRGSITSGIPIFNLQINNSHHSSEEDDETSVVNATSSSSVNPAAATNYFYGNGNNNMKYQQRRNSKSSRHEPYLDAFNTSPNSSSSLIASNTNTTGGQISPVGSFSRSITGRPREPSFSSTSNNTGNSIYANLIQHRSSEPPGQLELILANMSHLENIYNQSINAPQSQNQPKEADQFSHLINNLPQIYCNVEGSNYMNSFPTSGTSNTTPNISISAGGGTSAVSSNMNNSPSNHESNLASLLINAAAVAAAAAAYQQQTSTSSTTSSSGVGGSNNNSSSGSSMSTDLSSSTLQMIQEEQTEMMMGVHSSESESPMSSVSTTPRMNRSSFCYMPTPQQSSLTSSVSTGNGVRRSSLMNNPTTHSSLTNTHSHNMMLNSMSSAQSDLISKHLLNMLSNTLASSNQQQGVQKPGTDDNNLGSSSSTQNQP